MKAKMVETEELDEELVELLVARMREDSSDAGAAKMLLALVEEGKVDDKTALNFYREAVRGVYFRKI